VRSDPPPLRCRARPRRSTQRSLATIPILLAEAERSGKQQRGMKVAMVAFGSGFTWGGAIVDW